MALHSYLAVLASLKGFRRPVLLLDPVPNLLPIKRVADKDLNEMKARIETHPGLLSHNRGHLTPMMAG